MVPTTAPALETLFGPAELAVAVRRLADSLCRDLAGARVVFVPVMTGSLFFAVDLLRALDGRLGIEAISAAVLSSYGGSTKAERRPHVAAFPGRETLAGRVALLVDTVVDSGATAEVAIAEARARGASDAKLVCLLDKPAGRRCPVKPDWAGLVAPDRFLVGYGLDAGGLHRTLPCVAALSEPSR